MKMNKPVILILGVNGMVGHTVFNYFSINYPNTIFGSSRSKQGNKNIFYFSFKNNSKEIENIISSAGKIDYVINCIGVLKQNKETDYKINYTLPNAIENLSSKYKYKFIHISTDDVFSYMANSVNEASKTSPASDYGISKLRGETSSPSSLTIRTSFLGFEKNGKGLIEFINKSKNKKINGYINQTWTGCTTLQFAKLCELLVNENYFKAIRKKNNIIHFSPLGPVSKYEIISAFSKMLNNNTKIIKTESEIKINRELNSKYLSEKFLSNFSRDIDSSLPEVYKFENEE